MSLNESLNRIFESRQFETGVKAVFFVVWLVSGIAGIYPIPNATLRSQWAYGMVFGLLFMSMSTRIAVEIIKFLCAKSPRIDSFVERHWGEEK